MAAAVSRPTIPLGSSVPPMTAHAVSVSLPTWDDNVGYEEGDKRVVEKMETGYPRFFVHRSIQKLATLCLNKFGRPDAELAMLFPSPRVAAEARDFLASQTPSISSRTVEFVICPSITNLQTPCEPTSSKTSFSSASVEVIELQILLFPKEQWGFAKSFWQHTGDGVSSRLAERALNFLGELPSGAQASAPPTPLEAAPTKNSHYSKNRHYAKRQASVPSTPSVPVTPAQPTQNPLEQVDGENLSTDLTTYLEERYGRNLPLFNAPLAKQALKRRIAGGLLPSDEDFGKVEDVARGAAEGSGKKPVTPDDIYLYPGGMSAIWHAHNISRKVRRGTGEAEGKSISYGFPYIDTLKILEKWGPGGILFGQGGNEDIGPLSDMLDARKPDEPRILALFCEFPGNPLLRSPDLVKIRELADKHGFIVVVDETIGNFINVEVMTYADIVVSSLTKIFSGESNVMGGSLVLNPNSAFYSQLKAVLATDFEDLYYPEDVVYMERNSRDFRGRIKQVNDNAYDITEYLHSRSLEDTTTPSTGKAIKKVYYPRYVTPDIYAQAQRTPTLGKGGFGGLFSVTFTSLAASKAFFDTIQCAKGPSLGTSFTLASPYTLLAHYNELDWAAQYGVDAGLVRISVGQEDTASLRKWFEEAVTAAEQAA